jgi:class 3 adenylate cyclase
VSDTPHFPAWLQRESADPIPVTGNCSLGRAVGNDVVLVDDRVSRRHATIHAQGEHEFWLVDLGSRNGTYLNGRRVSQPTRLRDRDRIQIGPFPISFHVAEAGSERTSGTWSTDQTQLDLRSIPCWLLLADIAGSTALSRERTPEELAVLVGGWFGKCKDLIEDNGGTINKYLGDGLLAYWPVRDVTLAHVAQTLRDLRRLQDSGHPAFRVVVHHGRVLLGGIPSSGEESLAGPEVNFVFRQEKLAGELRQLRLASAAAAALLAPHIPLTHAGEHPLAGFDGTHAFHTF